MQVINLAVFTGDGSVHPISPTYQQAKWVQIVAESIASASAPARVGGPAVTAAIGEPLYQQGASQFWPQDTTDRTEHYELSSKFYFAASGDKISVSYAI